MTTDKKNRGLIVFLLILIVAIGYLSYQNAKDYSQLKEAFELEKKEIENELDNVIKDYDDAISRKQNVSEKLKNQLYKITKLRDTIKALKSSKYNLIRGYRKRISTLEKQNKMLFAQVDSLNYLNNELYEENVFVKEALGKKVNLNAALTRKNRLLFNSKRSLEEKVAKAGIIKTTEVVAVAMKENRRGKLSSTSRSSKINVFKISFDLLENKFSEEGLKSICIQIVDEDNEVVSPKGSVKLKSGSEIMYSDVFLADYQNQKLSLVSLIKVDKNNIKRGVYSINVFIDGIYSNKANVKLR